MKTNRAREALTRAVNKAIADGAPRYVNRTTADEVATEAIYDAAADKLTDVKHFLAERRSLASYRMEYGDLSKNRLFGYLNDAVRSLDQARVFLREAQAEETS